MKKMISTVAATALIMVTSAMSSDMYVGGGIASQSVTGMDSGMALVLNVGMPLAMEAGPGKIAVEGELSKSISAASQKTFAGTAEFDVTTLAAYATYTYDITNEFYVKPRLGLLHESAEASVAGISASETETGLSYTLGAGYVVSNNLNVYLDYAIVEADISNMTLGVSYKF